MLFPYDVSPSWATNRSISLVALLAGPVELGFQFNHLAYPGHYLPALDNVNVRNYFPLGWILGLAFTYPGCSH